MRGPLAYIGGKALHIKRLMPLVPPHNIYVEVFGGGASLLFHKDPSLVEVLNDIDSSLVNFYRVLRDEDKCKELIRLLELTPYSREELYWTRMNCECDDDIEFARRWFLMQRMSFGGNMESTGWKLARFHSSRGISSAVSYWLSSIELLPEVHERLKIVQIDNTDFARVIKGHDSEDTFFYLDPPYILSSGANDLYRYSMDANDHIRLVNLILSCKGKFMLSCYDNEIYDALTYAGWECADYVIGVNSSGGGNKLNTDGGKGKRIETVWLSPNCETLPELRRMGHLA